jgi:hypothetical protein
MHMCITTHIGLSLPDLFLLLPGPLPIVASAGLRLFYSLHYSEHINHIQVLSFLPFPYFSRAHSPLGVCPMFNNITTFVLGL